MKKTLRLTITLLMFGFFGTGFAQQCEIPGNYFQNPNMEHKLNAIFWYGSWDWVYWNNSIAWKPDFWITDTTDAHSGSHCMVLTEDSYVWPTVTTVGFEEKDMKISFWYKCPIGDMAFWNFIYRPVETGLTPEEVRVPLETIGADTAYIEWGETDEGVEYEDAIYWEMWGPKPDWTYFEFKWSYPGQIPGPILTFMFWSEYTPGFVDDIYHGIDFDCVYNGEEEFEIRNPDFEEERLSYDWTTNKWGGAGTTEFLSATENHTDGGAQSLKIWSEWQHDSIFIYDDVDSVWVFDSIWSHLMDYNVTYYLPAQGAAGENMKYGFWYKGAESTLDLYIYEDYDITPGEYPLPDNTDLLALNVIIDTTKVLIDTTFVYDSTKVLSRDTTVLIKIREPATISFQDFDTVTISTPLPLTWLWSNSDLYTWEDWTTGIVDDVSYSSPQSFWLPGDPSWTGAGGTQPGIEDNSTYLMSFMYKGQLQLDLIPGKNNKYDLVTDPDGIVPADASLGKSNTSIHWDLDTSEWTEFIFVWSQGSWLADSGIASPDTLVFEIAGSYVDGEVGYMDDIKFAEIVVPLDTLAAQDFNDDSSAPLPVEWLWSNADPAYYTWEDWTTGLKETDYHSAPKSLWLPGDPSWTGVGGSQGGFVDSATYSFGFMYKGQLQIDLLLGKSFKYDLVNDPDGIVPEDATLGKSDKSIHWDLDVDTWKEFSFVWEQGSWLQDSAVTSPAALELEIAGSYVDGEVGYLDDLLILKTKEKLGPVSVIDTNIFIKTTYEIDSIIVDTTYKTTTTYENVIVDETSELEPLAIHWTLPAAAEWTKFEYTWNNPSGDIGSSLTFVLESSWSETDSVTYFDDFFYAITTSAQSVYASGQLHLYPNPVIDVLYLSIEDPLSRIDVYNSMGQLVKSFNNPDRQINVSELSSGMYLMNVTDQRGNLYKAKFIKK